MVQICTGVCGVLVCLPGEWGRWSACIGNDGQPRGLVSARFLCAYHFFNQFYWFVLDYPFSEYLCRPPVPYNPVPHFLEMWFVVGFVTGWTMARAPPTRKDLDKVVDKLAQIVEYVKK
jgi:hypothetical protein